MDTIKVTRESAVKIILETKADGTFFSVKGIKRETGEIRYFKSCRGGVAKYVTGKGMAYDPATKGLISVWEAGNTEEKDGKDKYRLIAIEGILEVQSAGVIYEVIDKK